MFDFAVLELSLKEHMDSKLIDQYKFLCYAYEQAGKDHSSFRFISMLHAVPIWWSFVMYLISGSLERRQ